MNDHPVIPTHSPARRAVLATGARVAGALALGPVAACAQQQPTRNAGAAKGLQSIPEAAVRLRNGSLTSMALTQASFQAIDGLESRLAALISVTREQALETAAQRDAELAKGIDRGPLHGIPIVHKDLYDTAGIATTGGSEFYRMRVPATDATVVKRLHGAGAVMVGKANLNELAAGIASTNKAFGDTPNPWDLSRSSGGSSQGTGAAIAAGYCLAGTGGDTGGSIRVPASWCGIAGLRPTYGLVSLAGAMPRAHSLDTGGPLGKTVLDVAIMMNAMAGYDPAYRYSIRAPKVDYLAATQKGVRGLRVALIDNYSFRDVDADVAKAVQGGTDTLAQLGANVKTVKIPLLGAQFNYQLLFDLVLYEVNQILGDQFRATRNNKEVFGPVVQANIARGETISRETYEAARAVRPRQIAEVRRIFDEVDVLVTPTMPMTAIAQYAEAAAYDRGRQFSLPISFLGLPSISVPCGFDSAGMPIGMLLIGDHLQEAKLFQAAAAYEAVHKHYLRRPKWHADALAA
jgi:aspartyl-tRNA(Asn)/glutamyl-tRNA(Gln) amidotransferase subunit A